ncbi:unnamed protein product [Camellia sinensis]
MGIGEARCSGCTQEYNLHRPIILDEATDFFNKHGVFDFTFDTCRLWGWRCRAKLAVRGSSTNPLIGLYREGTHNVVDIPDCKDIGVATMYAVMLDTDYMNKPTFKENFMNDWRKILGKNHVIQKLEDYDFIPIYEWHQREKEKKKQMSSEGTLEEGETAEAGFIKIQAAYELLMNVEKRRQYDIDNRVNPMKASQAWMEWLMKKRKAFDQRGDMVVAAWAEQQQREMNLRVRHLSRSKTFEELQTVDEMFSNVVITCLLFVQKERLCLVGCRADASEAAIILLPSNITVFTLDFSGSGLSGGEHVTLGWNEVNG